MPLYYVFSVFHGILGYTVPKQCMVLPVSVAGHYTLGYIHYLSVAVFKSVGEHHQRKRLRRLGKRGFKFYRELLLAQKRQSCMRRVRRQCVNGGYNGMPRKACLNRRICLAVANFTYNHNIRVKTESRHNKILLRYIQPLILRRAGKRMHNIIYHLAVLFLDKRKLP